VTPRISPLSLHGALPISHGAQELARRDAQVEGVERGVGGAAGGAVDLGEAAGLEHGPGVGGGGVDYAWHVALPCDGERSGGAGGATIAQPYVALATLRSCHPGGGRARPGAQPSNST